MLVALVMEGDRISPHFQMSDLRRARSRKNLRKSIRRNKVC
jgi:hypothetical protein